MIDSICWRQGKIIYDKEVVLIIKTLKKNFKKIEKEVKKLHSYIVPFNLNFYIIHTQLTIICFKYIKDNKRDKIKESAREISKNYQNIKII